MQHTLNSICMTGWFFSSPRSSLQSVPSGSCQGRGGISLSDADSSCPSSGWMEWKWHHVYSGKMFPDPDQCQQDAGMLEDGKHARDQALDLFSWSTCCITHHTPHISHLPPPRTHGSPCPADPCTPWQQIATYTMLPHVHTHTHTHTPHTLPHTTQTYANTCYILHTLPPHTSHRHTPAHATQPHTHHRHIPTHTLHHTPFPTHINRHTPKHTTHPTHTTQNTLLHYTDTYQHMPHTTHTPHTYFTQIHTSHRHTPTHATMAAHNVHPKFTDTQTPRGSYRCTGSPPLSIEMTIYHIYTQVVAEHLGLEWSYRCSGA